MLEKSREVPRKVREALSNGDRVALSRMGHIGGEHAAALKTLEKEEKKHHVLEAALQQARTGEISPEGDILPPNPELVASLEEVLKE